MSRTIQSFSIILLGLASGFLFGRLVESRFLPPLREVSEGWRRALQRLVLLVVNPLSYCGAIWVLELSDPRLLLLPLVGLAALALGLALGFTGARALRLPPSRAGVHVVDSSFRNGSVGGLVAFVLLGEGAFALVPIYKLLDEFWYYTVLFPLARSYGEGRASRGRGAEGREGRLKALLGIALDPLVLSSIAAIAAGLGLNASGLPRPAFYGVLNSVLVPLGAFVFLFTIGMRLRLGIARDHAPAAALLTLGKTFLVPSVVLGLAWLLGLGALPGGQGLKVTLVMATMPTAFLGLVTATLFRLDEGFANSLWLASTGALVLTVPLLALLLPLLG